MNSFVKVGSSNYWPSNEKSKCYAKYYIFRTIIYIWDRACTCTWPSKKIANNKFTRRRKYYLVYILRPVQQPIYSMPYLPLFVEKYLFDWMCTEKYSIGQQFRFVSLHFISFSRLFNTLFVRVKKSSVLYKKGRKSYYNSCYKRGATKNECLAKNSGCILL